MVYLNFPNEEEWIRIHQQAPYIGYHNYLNEYLEAIKTENSFVALTRKFELKELVWQLHYRITDVAKSYIMMVYYFEKSIPDEDWKASPGSDGSSIEFFPHFDKLHYQLKDWFDYFSDMFYYKLFSAWDTIGHILNVQYKLEVPFDRVTFPKVIKKLKQVNELKWQEYDVVTSSPDYDKARNIRNNITHNYLPNSVGMSVTTKKGDGKIVTSVGVRNYVASKEIMINVPRILNLLMGTLNTMKDQNGN